MYNYYVSFHGHCLFDKCKDHYYPSKCIAQYYPTIKSPITHTFQLYLILIQLHRPALPLTLLATIESVWTGMTDVITSMIVETTAMKMIVV